ncbi:transposase [Pantoea sp. SORGH_AS 659]|nr:transposase [Pantoea sp. SORGH_AS_0659]
MRNGFNGLGAKIQTTLKDDPMSGHVLIFCGRFARPSARDGKVFLTPALLTMPPEGIDWRQPKRLVTKLTML